MLLIAVSVIKPQSQDNDGSKWPCEISSGVLWLAYKAVRDEIRFHETHRRLLLPKETRICPLRREH